MDTMEDDDVYYDAVLYIAQDTSESVLVQTTQVAESTFVQSSHQVFQDNQQWECKNRTLVFLKDFNFEDDSEFQMLGLSKESVQVLVDNAWVRSISFHAKANTYLNEVNPHEIYEIFTLDPLMEDYPSPMARLDAFLRDVKTCSDFTIAKSGLAKKVADIRKKFCRFETESTLLALP